MRLAAMVAGDAREALELTLRLYEQAREDQARATEHIRRAHELIRGEE
jgi:hypothetical protein